uniref:DUF6534 domain-containing protein n=1 Tax=Mycena chlorophos TaxID=658473 RepID=A0ABQ0L643_MYCCL|nr:predicted protein [Mycena chlorophos]
MPNSAKSVIQLTPLSAAFVDGRRNTLGPWVLGGFADSVLMGVIFCQALVYYKTRPPARTALQTYYNCVVLWLVGLSMIKTAQCIGTVWIQNVMDFANPDVARLLVADAWWQVTMPLMTAIIGTTVQIFFCLRYYMLSRNWVLCIPIAAAMCVGLAGVCLSLVNILRGNAEAKIKFLLMHLVGVFAADFLITSGTFISLRKRNSDLEWTNQLINRLVRIVFESAIPPTVIATIDLILTQTLGEGRLLWHMLMNISLGKVYVVSLLYTLNSINAYRTREGGSHEVYSYNERGESRRTNLEFAARRVTGGFSNRPHDSLNHTTSSGKEPEIFVHTQVSTHVSPEDAPDIYSPRSLRNLGKARKGQAKTAEVTLELQPNPRERDLENAYDSKSELQEDASAKRSMEDERGYVFVQ